MTIFSASDFIVELFRSPKSDHLESRNWRPLAFSRVCTSHQSRVTSHFALPLAQLRNPRLCFLPGGLLLRVVVNTASSLAAQPPFLDVLPQQRIGPVLFAKRLMEIFENLEPHVQTDEIDQLEGAHRMV